MFLKEILLCSPNRKEVILIKIAIDVMGGDKAPKAIISGALKAIDSFDDLNLILIGKHDIIKNNLNKNEYSNHQRLEIENASDIVGMEDSPSKSIRKKKNSSIYIGTSLVNENKADAFISAGNTGAVMAASLLNIGRIAGIKRPSIATVFPSISGKTLVMDAGANVDSKAKNLLQFAIMGQIYYENIFNKKDPYLGLLSIGEEKQKGNKLTAETYELLENDNRITNFCGNVEGRDIFNKTCDIVICDGFTGNIVLKTSEGAIFYIMDLFKNLFKRNIMTKLGAVLIKPFLKSVKNKIDYRQYGGAPLLGINGVVIISHGSSDEVAITSAIKVARDTVNKNVVNLIEDKISEVGGC